MLRLLIPSCLVLALALAPAAVMGQEGKAPAAKAAPATPKLAKDEKLCQYRFPSGEKRAWVCKKEQPCCAWDAISYVKCGSTITGCL